MLRGPAFNRDDTPAKRPSRWPADPKPSLTHRVTKTPTSLVGIRLISRRAALAVAEKQWKIHDVTQCGTSGGEGQKQRVFSHKANCGKVSRQRNVGGRWGVLVTSGLL